MKYLSIILFLCAMTLEVTAQCDYYKNEYSAGMEHETKILNASLLIDQQSTRNSPVVKVYGTLQKVGGDFSTWLTILVPSGGQASLGKLYDGSTLKMFIDNGETIEFKVQHVKLVEETGSYKFGLSLPLGKNRFETLQGNKVKKIEIPWSMGAQNYMLLNENFFISQLPCLL